MTMATATFPPVAVTRDGLAGAVRKARQAANLKQEELADLMGTSTTTVSDIETGKRELTVERLYEVAKHTGRSPWELLADAGAVEPSARDRLAAAADLDAEGRETMLRVYDSLRRRFD